MSLRSRVEHKISWFEGRKEVCDNYDDIEEKIVYTKIISVLKELLKGEENENK